MQSRIVRVLLILSLPMQETLSLTELLNGPDLASEQHAAAAAAAALPNAVCLGQGMPSVTHSLDEVSFDGAYLDDMWDELGNLGLDAHEPEM